MNRDQLEQRVNEQTELSRRHLANMNAMKPEMKRLNKLRDFLKKSVAFSLFGCIYIKKLKLTLTNFRKFDAETKIDLTSARGGRSCCSNR